MATNNRNRQPKGTSKGGQFAPETHTVAPNDLETGEQPSIVYYYPDGTIDSEEWRNEDGKLDRADGPAYAAYSPDGTIKREEYWQDGTLHREDGPAVINYNEDGNVKSERWYLDNAPIDPIVK